MVVWNFAKKGVFGTFLDDFFVVSDDVLDNDEVLCEEESRCTICGERNEMGVKYAFWVNLLKLEFF